MPGVVATSEAAADALWRDWEQFMLYASQPRPPIPFELRVTMDDEHDRHTLEILIPLDWLVNHIGGQPGMSTFDCYKATIAALFAKAAKMEYHQVGGLTPTPVPPPEATVNPNYNSCPGDVAARDSL